nr:Chain P, Nociceptin [Homo sapiens]
FGGFTGARKSARKL